MRLKPLFESIASKYGIRGIPVIKFFCEEKEVGEIVGYVPQNEMEKKISEMGAEAQTCLANTPLK
jgi:thioredoxin-related protein